MLMGREGDDFDMVCIGDLECLKAPCKKYNKRKLIYLSRARAKTNIFRLVETPLDLGGRVFPLSA